MHIHTYTHIRTHKLTHTHAHVHAHTHTHARTQICPHTHLHTRTHAHTHAHIHTFTHRAYDTVDVEPERLPPPDAGPGRWGAPPPPPPPPPRPDHKVRLERSPFQKKQGLACFVLFFLPSLCTPAASWTLSY